MISHGSRRYSFLNEKRIPPSHFAHILTMLKDNSGKRLKRIHTDNSGEYISNELKDFVLTSRVIHELTPPYSPESNCIAERFNQTINTIACSMIIAVADLPCLWAEAVNMAAYLKTRLPHKHLPSSTMPFERFYRKKPIISHLKPFGSKCSVHIREEERSSRSKHLPPARVAINVGYTSSPKVYRVFTLEDEYVFMARDLTFAKITSPQVATNILMRQSHPIMLAVA
jgi:transposase InsO family protein